MQEIKTGLCVICTAKGGVSRWIFKDRTPFMCGYCALELYKANAEILALSYPHPKEVPVEQNNKGFTHGLYHWPKR